MKRDIISNLLTIAIIVTLVIAIYIGLQILFGNSPSLLDLIIAFIVGLVFNAGKMWYDFGTFKGESREFRANVRDSFLRNRADIKEIKEDVKEIKSLLKRGGRKI